MEFYPVWNSFDNIGKKYYGKDWKKYYYEAVILKKPIYELDKNRFSRPSLAFEWGWFKAGKPYYQIWPSIADEFIKTRIDIDSDLLRPPHQVFAIKLPILGDPILSFPYRDGMTAFIRGIIVNHTVENGQRHLYWRVTFSVKEIENPGNMGFHLLLDEGKTIEYNIGRFVEFEGKDMEDKTFTIPASIMDAILRLIVGVHFLATGSHKVLEFDVLSKHLSAYRSLKEGDPKRKKMEEKAIEKGKFGWNIGHGRGERLLHLPRGMTYEQAIRNAGGRELLYQHERGGHWHTVLYGEGRTKRKVVWFDETTIRPDLPPKPI